MASLIRALPLRSARVRHRAGLLSFWSLFRQRQSLRDLDDRLLRDIGVTRLEADAEAGRPAWDAPDHWRN